MATEKKVYEATTQPLPKRTCGYYNRKDKSDLGVDFVAPDGGWAWLVCVAAGVSNLSLYPCLQQFGFMFRERLTFLGMTSSQVTAIINTNPAVSACTGLLNGPMFRRFTFRQVAMVGALLCFSGIALTAFCETFAGYIFAYAGLYGFGMGISVSASSLAINTYFKQKRRRAAGFSWTITGLGPIFLPYLVTFMLSVYDVQGTVLLFAAISLHAFVSALIYQPVRYHTATATPAAAAATTTGAATTDATLMLEQQPEVLCPHCTLQRKREPGGIFSSQYLCQDDDAQRPGYEIIEPGTPMLSRANDGWYGSKLSLSSGRMRFRTISSSKDLELTQRLHSPISEDQQPEEEDFLRPNNFRREREESNLESKLCCTCSEQRALYAQLHAEQGEKQSEPNNNEEQVEGAAQMTFLQKLVMFFDLDLLRDVTFVNLVIGLTVINFGELNFSILTPFILKDFGFDTPQITVAMSLMAGMDIIMRFLVPFLTEKIPWDNRVFFLIGVVGIAIGRTIVASTRSYGVILSCFVWIGLCKGVRTIFWPLIIPGYVPLNRLPGASGLQLLISGLFTLLGGPFVGLVRDRYNFSVALHCLDAMTFMAAAAWALEALLHRRRRKMVS